MITAQLSVGTMPVDLVQWTRTGMVQTKRVRTTGAILPAFLGVFEAVPVMMLTHSDGRDALIKVLAALPREE